MIIGISGKIGSGKDTVGSMIQYIGSDYYPDKSYTRFMEKRNSDWAPPFTEWDIKKYADALKDIVCILIGCTREELEDSKFKEKELGEEWWYYQIYENGNMYSFLDYKERMSSVTDEKYYLIKHTPRTILQLLGTEAGRNIIHPNIWVNALMRDYFPGEITDGSKWIVTDVRMKNELDAIKNRGGVIIGIERPVEFKPGDSAEVKVFSNWSPIIYTHTDDDGYNYGVGTDGYVYKSKLIRKSNQHESEIALDEYTNWDYVIQNTGSIDDLYKQVLEIYKSICS